MRAWTVLLFLGLALGQSPEALLAQASENLARAPWQAEVRGKVQGPTGLQELQVRLYALPGAKLFRLEFLRPPSLEGNFTVITEKEVWNYLYLTNQLIVQPKERAGIQNLGVSPAFLGDPEALTRQVRFELLGRTTTPLGPAHRLLGQARGDLGFSRMELLLLERDLRPVRMVAWGPGGEVVADLEVVAFERKNLRAESLKRYPKDAQVVRR